MSGLINVLATIEPRPEDGINIVEGVCDKSWTPFWIPGPVRVPSQRDMISATKDALNRAMKHFGVENLSDLEMLEMRGIRVVHPYRPDGTQYDDYVIHIRKKAPVS